MNNWKQLGLELFDAECALRHPEASLERTQRYRNALAAMFAATIEAMNALDGRSAESKVADHNSHGIGV